MESRVSIYNVNKLLFYHLVFRSSLDNYFQQIDEFFINNNKKTTKNVECVNYQLLLRLALLTYQNDPFVSLSLIGANNYHCVCMVLLHFPCSSTLQVFIRIKYVFPYLITLSNFIYF